MILLVAGATRYQRTDTVGVLVEPRTWALPDTLDLQPGRWAMDNGAFAGFDEGAFVRMLERFSGGPGGRVADKGCDGSTSAAGGCLFVTAPDVVGDAASTLARWPFWSRLIRGLGHAPAFVAQDGITEGRVPWPEIGALFIGGTTAFKESAEARSLCGLARAKGIWVHWGRVNGRRRYELALKAGAQSIDGTGFSMYPNTNIPLADEWHAGIQAQPELDL